MSDAELLQAAIDASGIVDPRDGKTPSTRGFSRRVIDMDDGTARAILAQRRELTPLQRRVCRAIVRRPRLTRELERAGA